MFWYVKWTPKTSSATFDVEITDVDVQYQVKGLDYAKCKSATQIPTEEYVVMYNPEGAEVIRGYVKKNKRAGKDINGDDIFEIEIHESAVELQQMRIASVDGGSIGSQRVYFDERTLRETVDAILWGSGWGHDPSWSYVVPSEKTPKMMFYYASKLDGLFKVIRALYGYDVWFSDDGVHKYVYYGLLRYRWGSIDGIILDSTSEYNSTKRVVDFVKVLGKTDSINAQWPTGSMALDAKIAVYRYDDLNNSDEALRLAQQVYNDIKLERVTIKVELNQPVAYIREADTVTLSGMEYHVKGASCREQTTTLTLSADEITIFDLLDSKLKEVTGEIKEGSAGTWDGGWQNVSGGTVEGSAWPGKGKWLLSISDVNNVQDFNLVMQTDKYRKDLTTQLSPAGTTSTMRGTGVGTWVDSANTYTNFDPTGNKNIVGSAYTYGDFAPASLTLQAPSQVGDAGHRTVQMPPLSELNANQELIVGTVIPPPMEYNGYQFGFIVHSAHVIPDTDCTLTAVIFRNNIQDTNPINLFLQGGKSYAVVFPFAVKGNWSSTGVYYDVKALCTSHCSYLNHNTMLTIFPRHIHGTLEPNSTKGHLTNVKDLNGVGHGHEVNDVGHKSNIQEWNFGPDWAGPGGTGFGHYTRINDQGHEHGTTEPNESQGHETGEDINTVEINSYPEDIIVQVINDAGTDHEVVRWSSGVIAGIPQGGSKEHKWNIQEHLRTGTNRIDVYSTKPGSVYLCGDYTNYGAGV